jgi:transaldolase
VGKNPLVQLRDLGQSVWYDDIGRRLLTQGSLAAMIAEDGVAGVTSNPTIFNKAIAETADYDDAMRVLVESGLDTGEIFDRLTSEDVAAAADLLRDTWVGTAGVDGRVSIEVAPALAYDEEATVTEAHRLRALVGRSNIMVKVPATEPGVRAFRTLTGQGISINVTLIFSLQRYAEVMEAYLSGLEELVARRGRGEDLPSPDTVASVASFFVSRVDSKVDARLEHLASVADDIEVRNRLLSLRGTAAVANAKIAYQEFLRTFAGERWDVLEAAGARVQRPLWASTSTKNPAYRDVLYVEELIGPDTVNTMPQVTVDAFRDHGVAKPMITAGVDEARAQLAAIDEAGISMAEVTAELEAEGVQAFADSFDALWKTIQEKRALLKDGHEG